MGEGATALAEVLTRVADDLEPSWHETAVGRGGWQRARQRDRDASVLRELADGLSERSDDPTVAALVEGCRKLER